MILQTMLLQLHICNHGQHQFISLTPKKKNGGVNLAIVHEHNGAMNWILHPIHGRLYDSDIVGQSHISR